MAAQLTVQTTPSGQLVVVTMSGEFDLATSDRLRAALAQACALPHTTVVLDFAQVTFVDSTTLGVLVGANKRARVAGGRIVVVNVSGLPLKVMTLTGLAEAFELYDEATPLDAELAGWLAELATPPTAV